MSGSEERVQPLLVCGTAGSGKSHWIHEYAKEKNLEVLVCPCRIDRTLREQRTKLHEWAHRLQPSILWLEGADDLTPEAQSFLRRILETNSPSIHFILECRTIESIQEPIKSRCLIKMINAPSRQELFNYATSPTVGLTVEQFNHYYDIWPPSKRTWRQILGLKFMLNDHYAQLSSFTDTDTKIYNIWDIMENEFNDMSMMEQHDYLHCRHLGGNPLAFSALRSEMKKQVKEKDGK
jgi:hypothetical protein